MSSSKTWLCNVSVSLALPPLGLGGLTTPRDPLKLFIYGYLNRILSSRRLEREVGYLSKLARLNTQWMIGAWGYDAD
jgi:hypothetical protein